MPRSPANGYLTTGNAAVLCGVCQQTIIRAVDAGLLPAWRVPGSRFRRIARSDLYQFMVDNDIPVDKTHPLWGDAAALAAQIEAAAQSGEPASG